MNKVIFNNMTIVQHSPDSINRLIPLKDGTLVNPEGYAKFNGESVKVTCGIYKIKDIWCGSESGDRFLGVEIDGQIYRYPDHQFSEGTPHVPSFIENYWTRGGDYNKV